MATAAFATTAFPVSAVEVLVPRIVRTSDAPVARFVADRRRLRFTVFLGPPEATAFLVEARLAGVLFAAGFFAVDVAVVFFAVVCFAWAFFAVVAFFAVAFFAVVFLAVDLGCVFLVAEFLAADSDADFRAVGSSALPAAVVGVLGVDVWSAMSRLPR